MCIAASARPTITGASPSFGAESATATQFFFVSNFASAGKTAIRRIADAETVTRLDYGFNR
jgi:hypothetical protein